MATFEDLVEKLMHDQAFSDKFHDTTKRDGALTSIGIDPGQKGLKDALNNIDYDAIHKLKTILNTPLRPFN
jgi:hypothetical protein